MSEKSLELGKFEYLHYGSSRDGDILIFLTLMTFRIPYIKRTETAYIL